MDTAATAGTPRVESVAPGPAADRLRPLRIAIVKHAHTVSGGAEDYLRDYLVGRTATCAMLAHPFPDARGVPPESRWRVYEAGNDPHDTVGWRGRGPAVLHYLRDVAETFRRMLFGRRWDVYVGVDNLNATVGVLLRWVGRVRTVVFYVIDYVPERFENPLLNRLYHALDRFAAKRADCTWNVSAHIVDARRDRGLPLRKCGPQLAVPVGAPLPTEDPTKALEPTVVFMGHLAREQGVDRLLEAWPRVLELVPTAALWIMGSGEEEASLRERAVQLGLADGVQWLGFVPDEQVHEALGSAWVAVAPYPDVSGQYKQYADPGKFRWYCAAGLPIVTTDVPAAAADLADRGAAQVVPAQGPLLANAIGELLRDAAARARMGAAARELGRTYTWDAIFDAAWDATWPHLERRLPQRQ